ncbi:MAG: methyltransferase [Verrucomicrobiales bacterium]|nr:methyltransferase [Verrucomicrobiales bacterium]|tara:strand:+ start:3406 stop:4104 length:699 start_codon:yes stop_codon:yes gene_type:complete
MASESQDQNPLFVHRAFSSIAERYVLANHVLSFGIDIIWRKKVSRFVAETCPDVVLDVATGSGDLAAEVQKGSPEARVIGADFCAPMLAEARKRGLENLIVADGLALPLPDDSVDALTIGYGLRNISNWAAAITEFSRVLKPGGLLVVLDFSLPTSPMLNRPYRFYLHRILPVLAGWLTGNREAYAYLGESIERFPSGKAMQDLIIGNGFDSADWYPQFGGISSVYAGKKSK